MKLGKKLMVVAMAVATFGLVGCNMNEDEFNMIDFDAPAGTANINYTNLSDNQYTRGWRTFNSKHQDADCTIRFKKPSSNESNGNMGYIFNMKKNDDKSISFDCVTVGYKGTDSDVSSKGLNFYASRYENIGKDYINGNLRNFADIDGVVIGTGTGSKATETSLKESSKEWQPLTGIIEDGDGYYNIYIDLTWDDNANTYSLAINDADKEGKNWEKVSTTVFEITGLAVLDPEAKNATDPQYPLGAYAMAIKDQTVEGDWIFTNFTKEPIVLEEIDF